MSWKNRQNDDSAILAQAPRSLPRRVIVENDFCVLVTYKNGDEFPLLYDNKQMADTILKDMCAKIIEGLKAKVYSNDEGALLVIFGNVLNVTMVEMEDGDG